MVKEVERLRAVTRIRRLEAEMEAVFEKALRDLVARTVAHAGLEALEDKTSITAALNPTDLNILLSTWQAEVKNGITPQMEKWYREQWNIASDLLPPHVNAFIGENVRDVRAVQYVKNLENRLVGIGNTLYDSATDAMQIALETGEGAAKAALRVNDVLDVGINRATTIARTEAAAAVNGADFAIAQELNSAGIVTMKTWLATNDDRTRESHVEADGQSVPVDDPFSVGGEDLMYPGDPDGEAGEVVNCRCTTLLELADGTDVGEFDTGETPELAVLQPGEAMSQVLMESNPSVRGVDFWSESHAGLDATRTAMRNMERGLSDIFEGIDLDQGTFLGYKESKRYVGSDIKYLYGNDALKNDIRNAAEEIRKRLDGAVVPHGPLYRGMRVADPESLFSVGEIFDANLTSWSTSERIAKQFAETTTGKPPGAEGWKPVIMTVDDAPAADLSTGGRFDNQEEYVTNSQMQVVSIHEEDGVVYVGVQHVKPKK